jgi:hypothetical protein
MGNVDFDELNQLLEEANKPLAQEVKIYPYTLWKLYDDVCLLFYGNLPFEERQKIEERLPCGISDIEQAADALLMQHVADMLDRIGPRRYAELVRESMTNSGFVIFLLRCLIACLDVDSQPDKVEIRTNKAIDALEFAALLASSGTRQEFVDDDGKAIDIKSINVSDKFITVVSTQDMKSRKTARDRMPVELIPTIQEALERMGIAPKNLKEAWDELEPKWKRASINEKITSRVAYLIMNSVANRDAKEKVNLLTFQKH